MNDTFRDFLENSTLKIIKKCEDKNKISNLIKKHNEKIHFIPKRYRVFGGLLQSMNIQFGNYIEALMSDLISNDGKYEIIEEYSGKKSNSFKISETNERRIDDYISRCQTEIVNTELEFPLLMEEILNDNDKDYKYFKHDIDLLFKERSSEKIFYLEIKYNDDHDTGKFVDINRKFIKTYAYLVKELNIKNRENLIPILFYFTNNRLKGNIYLPEGINIKRGKRFFDEFLSVDYDELDKYMENFSESDFVGKVFDDLYEKIMSIMVENK